MNPEEQGHNTDSSNKRVQFENEWRPDDEFSRPKTPKLVKLVIENSGGLIKDENQANIFLIALAAVFVILAIAILIFGRGPEAPINQPPLFGFHI